MAANFPDNPTNGQTFTSNGITFTWNGSVWKLDPSSGTKGQKGQQGIKGNKGQKGFGNKGIKGEAIKGDKGAAQKGQKGEPGSDGQDGQDGSPGSPGSPGADGNDGQDGSPGSNGVDGTPGSDGNDGTPGSNGVDGTPGSDGNDGTPGSDGVDGTPGSDGVDGTPGSPGSPGPPGPAGSGLTPAIVHSQLTNDPTTNSSSYQNAISLTINPTASGSTLLISAGGMLAGYRQDYYDDPEQAVCEAKLFRGSTALGNSIVTGFGPDNTTGYIRFGFYLSFRDTYSHGGNNVTYHLKFRRNPNSDGQNVQVKQGSSMHIQEII